MLRILIVSSIAILLAGCASAPVSTSLHPDSPGRESTPQAPAPLAAENLLVSDGDSVIGSFDPSLEHRDLLARVEVLIDERKYASAFSMLEETSPKGPALLAKQVEVGISYFAQSVMHRVFTFKDLEPGETLEQVRIAGTGGQMHAFDPEALLLPLLEEYGEITVLQVALADYYYDGYSRYGDDWFTPAIEALKQASDLYTAAIEAEEAPTRAYVRSGEYLLRTGEFSRARGLLQTAIELEPTHPRANYNLAFALINLKQRETALEHASVAAAQYESAPHRFDAQIMAGRLALELLRYDEAIRFLLAAQETEPRAYEPLSYLILAYLGSGDPVAAAAASGELFSRYPDNPNVNRMILQHYQEYDALEAYVRLTEELEGGFKGGRVQGNILFHRGVALYFLGESAQSIEALELSRAQFRQVFAEDHAVYREIDNLILAQE